MDYFALSVACFWVGFAVGYWAGRKQALHPTYFSERVARLIAKVRK